MMIGDRLTMEEIKQRFDREWVLLEDPEFTEDDEILGGRLLFHTPDRDELYRRALELRPKHSAIEFVGELRTDLSYVL